jgi:hypothetical protein
MTDNANHEPNDDLLKDRDFAKPDGADLEGEGSYDATKAYNARLKRFLESQGKHVEDLAEDAADSLGDSDELTDAEKEGLKKARH